MSAGRLYDKIGKSAYAKVELVTPVGTICKVCKKSLKNEKKEMEITKNVFLSWKKLWDELRLNRKVTSMTDWMMLLIQDI